MVVVEVDVLLTLPMVMDTTLIPPSVDIIVIMVPLVVVMVAIWMFHMVQLQKAPYLLSQSKGLGKADKKGMSSQVSSSTV